MSAKSDKVKSGYADLSPAEKIEIKRFIEEYDRSSISEQRTFTEKLDRALNKSLGPKFDTSCPCCGK